MRNAVWLLAGLILAVGGAGLAQGTVDITFWAAPNPPQEVFWRQMAEAYMAVHPGVRITVSAMPEVPTSEAGILAAIAGGVAPTASENIFIGFGEELARARAIIPLDTLPGWEDLVRARTMDLTIGGWPFPDGHYYVLPAYSNAILFGWRIDILRELGYDHPPRTYSEVLEVGAKLRARYPEKFAWVRGELMEAPTWWERWFDFFTLYYAASGGQQLITGKAITADDRAAVEVLRFLQQMVEKELLLTEPLLFSFEEGHSIMTVLGPWTFPIWAEMFPELKYGEHFVLSPPPVPDWWPADEPAKTFADAKGIVLYAQATPEQRQAMWDFIRWVYSKPENDLRWLEITRMAPARDDVATNPLFAAFFEKHPALVSYAASIPYAVPPFAHPQFVEIKRVLGAEAIFPVIIGELGPEEAWEVWKSLVIPLL